MQWNCSGICDTVKILAVHVTAISAAASAFPNVFLAKCFYNFSKIYFMEMIVGQWAPIRQTSTAIHMCDSNLLGQLTSTKTNLNPCSKKCLNSKVPSIFIITYRSRISSLCWVEIKFSVVNFSDSVTISVGSNLAKFSGHCKPILAL